MSRLPAISPDALTPQQKVVYDNIAGGARGSVRGPFTALLHSPALAGRVEQLGVYLRYECAVPERLRELAILAVAARWQCHYEWFAHAPLAERQGFSTAVLDAVARREMPEFETDADRETYAYAAELLRAGQVDKGQYDRTRDTLGLQGIVDLTGLIGYYTLLAMTLNAHDVRPPLGTPSPWND